MKQDLRVGQYFEAADVRLVTSRVEGLIERPIGPKAAELIARLASDIREQSASENSTIGFNRQSQDVAVRQRDGEGRIDGTSRVQAEDKTGSPAGDVGEAGDNQFSVW